MTSSSPLAAPDGIAIDISTDQASAQDTFVALDKAFKALLESDCDVAHLVKGRRREVEQFIAVARQILRCPAVTDIVSLLETLQKIARSCIPLLTSSPLLEPALYRCLSILQVHLWGTCLRGACQLVAQAEDDRNRGEAQSVVSWIRHCSQALHEAAFEVVQEKYGDRPADDQAAQSAHNSCYAKFVRVAYQLLANNSSDNSVIGLLDEAGRSYLEDVLLTLSRGRHHSRGVLRDCLTAAELGLLWNKAEDSHTSRTWVTLCWAIRPLESISTSADRLALLRRHFRSFFDPFVASSKDDQQKASREHKADTYAAELAEAEKALFLEVANGIFADVGKDDPSRIQLLSAVALDIIDPADNSKWLQLGSGDPENRILIELGNNLQIDFESPEAPVLSVIPVETVVLAKGQAVPAAEQEVPLLEVEVHLSRDCVEHSNDERTEAVSYGKIIRLLLEECEGQCLLGALTIRGVTIEPAGDLVSRQPLSPHLRRLISAEAPLDMDENTGVIRAVGMTILAKYSSSPDTDRGSKSPASAKSERLLQSQAIRERRRLTESIESPCEMDAVPVDQAEDIPSPHDSVETAENADQSGKAAVGAESPLTEIDEETSGLMRGLQSSTKAPVQASAEGQNEVDQPSRAADASQTDEADPRETRQSSTEEPQEPQLSRTAHSQISRAAETRTHEGAGSPPRPEVSAMETTDPLQMDQPRRSSSGSKRPPSWMLDETKEQIEARQQDILSSNASPVDNAEPEAAHPSVRASQSHVEENRGEVPINTTIIAEGAEMSAIVHERGSRGRGRGRGRVRGGGRAGHTGRRSAGRRLRLSRSPELADIITSQEEDGIDLSGLGEPPQGLAEATEARQSTPPQSSMLPHVRLPSSPPTSDGAVTHTAASTEQCAARHDSAKGRRDSEVHPHCASTAFRAQEEMEVTTISAHQSQPRKRPNRARDSGIDLADTSADQTSMPQTQQLRALRSQPGQSQGRRGPTRFSPSRHAPEVPHSTHISARKKTRGRAIKARRGTARETSESQEPTERDVSEDVEVTIQALPQIHAVMASILARDPIESDDDDLPLEQSSPGTVALRQEAAKAKNVADKLERAAEKRDAESKKRRRDKEVSKTVEDMDGIQDNVNDLIHSAQGILGDLDKMKLWVTRHNR